MAIGELTDEDAHLYGSIDKDRIFRWIMDVAARLAGKFFTACKRKTRWSPEEAGHCRAKTVARFEGGHAAKDV